MNRSLLLISSLVCVISTSCTLSNPFSKDPVKTPSNNAASKEMRNPEKLMSGATQNRKKMIESLKTQWIDVSSVTPDMLDASKTPESIFGPMYQKLWWATDIPRRTALVEYFRSQNLDVSGFTTEVIADGAKFEALRAITEKEMVKKSPIPVPVNTSQTGSTSQSDPMSQTGAMEWPFRR